MAYTFAIDKEQLYDLKQALLTESNAIKTKIDEIFSFITDGWQDAWQGEAYNVFCNNCLKYKDALQEVDDVLLKFIQTIGHIEIYEAGPLIEKVEEKLASIT